MKKMSSSLFYYNQNNYSNLEYNKPDGTQKTIKSSGCGVVSACIAFNTLAQKEIYTVKSMRDIAKKCGARTNNGTNENKLLSYLCKQNFTFKISRDTNELISHLKNGGVAICNQGDAYDLFSSEGHYVVAYKINKNNNIFIADPSNYSNKYKINGRNKKIIKITKYGCVVSPKELSKATSDRYPSYYLISKVIDRPNVNKGDTITMTNKNYCYKGLSKQSCYLINELTKFNSSEKAQLKIGSKLKVENVFIHKNNSWIRTIINKQDVYIIVYDYKKDTKYIK